MGGGGLGPVLQKHWFPLCYHAVCNWGAAEEQKAASFMDTKNSSFSFKVALYGSVSPRSVEKANLLRFE